MSQSQKLLVGLTFFFGLFMIFVGTLRGDFTYYTLGSLVTIVLIIYSFMRFSSKSLILLVVAVFLCLRYIPIVKYNQPLFADTIGDLAVAREFEKSANLRVLERSAVHNAEIYSGWPLVHVFAITVSEVTGLPLLSVFTFFPPVVALSNLLFLYLLANAIFKSQRIGALASLVYATYSINIHWEIQLVRQNIAFALALFVVYVYVKDRMDNKIKMTALSLLIFAILPIAHHLTAMEIFYIFSVAFLLALVINFCKDKLALKLKVSRSPLHRPSTWTFLILMCTLILLWWDTFARDVIFRLFTKRFFTILLGLVGEEKAGGGVFGAHIEKTGITLGLFGVLSQIRLVFLGIATICGIFLLVKSKNPHKPILYAFILAPSSLLLIAYLFERGAEERHALFLIVPMALLAATAIHKLKRRWALAICLLIITLPAPFKLFTGWWQATPIYIYDKSSTYDFMLRERPSLVYRDDQTLASVSYFSAKTNASLIGDYYTAVAFLLHYDPYKVIALHSNINWIRSADSPIIVTHNEYYEAHLQGLSKTPVIQFLNTSLSNRVYDNSKVTGQKIPNS